MSDYSPPYTEEDEKQERQQKLVIARIRKVPLFKLKGIIYLTS